MNTAFRQTTWILAALASLSAAMAAQAKPPAPPNSLQMEPGAMVMGFDQAKTTHHFALYADGGAIEVTVNDSADIKDLNAIQFHLPHLAGMFAQGNFQAPMLVHGRNVPGTATLAALRDRISYAYAATARGGRIEITTRDAKALAALYEFLRFQIADHRTGDSTTPKARPRGRA